MSINVECRVAGHRIVARRMIHLPGTRQWAIETNVGTMVVVHPGALYPLYGPHPITGEKKEES